MDVGATAMEYKRPPPRSTGLLKEPFLQRPLGNAKMWADLDEDVKVSGRQVRMAPSTGYISLRPRQTPPFSNFRFSTNFQLSIFYQFPPFAFYHSPTFTFIPISNFRFSSNFQLSLFYQFSTFGFYQFPTFAFLTDKLPKFSFLIQ